MAAAASADIWVLAPEPSVRSTASARPFRQPDRATTAAGVAPSGGDVSAVMTKALRRRSASSRPPDLGSAAVGWADLGWDTLENSALLDQLLQSCLVIFGFEPGRGTRRLGLQIVATVDRIGAPPLRKV